MLVHEFIAVGREEFNNEVSYKLIRYNNCVKIKDNIIVNNPDFFSSFKSHWKYIGNENEGLDYHGITIIVNQDLQMLINVLNMNKDFNNIKNLILLCLTELE